MFCTEHSAFWDMVRKIEKAITSPTAKAKATALEAKTKTRFPKPTGNPEWIKNSNPVAN